MKKTLLVLLMATTCYAGSAQKKGMNTGKASGFSLGIEGAIPVGSGSAAYSHMLGGTVQYETMPSNDFGLTLSSGYINFAFKSSYGGGSLGFVPLMAGFKYYFSPVVFAHGQLGAAFGTDSGQGTNFAYSPGLGYKFSTKVDAELKYLGLSNKGGSLGNVGLRLAYNF